MSSDERHGLKVLESGLYTLAVDLGRPHCRSLGVPVGGAADRGSLALGNVLVGNPANTPALEISLAGPTLEAEIELACVLYGAPFDLSIGERVLVPGKTFTLQPGERLCIGGTAHGMRAYLCLHGGFDEKAVLGSHSSFQPLQAGDKLLCQPSAIPARFVRLPLPWSEERKSVAVVHGPQAEWFDVDEFYGQEFTVTPASDRMGLRVEGKPLAVPDRELVSEPVSPGAVQVTRDGQCIILGVDGQTIGGYPKIAHVIQADLDRLAQLRPGDRISFERVTLEEAERLYQAGRRALREWLTRLQISEWFGAEIQKAAVTPDQNLYPDS